MTTIKEAADIVYRLWKTDGVPSSGVNKPDPGAIRALFAQVDGNLTNLLLAVAVNGPISIAATRAALYATNPASPPTLGIAYADPTPGYSGFYVHATAGTGAANWPKFDITLPASVLADVAALQSAVDGKAPLVHSHVAATSVAAGFMAAADKTKLDTVETSADVTGYTNVSTALAGADAHGATPADTDGFLFSDSEDGGKAKRLLWSNLKVRLQALFDPLYQPISDVLTATTAAFTTAKNDKLSGIEAGADVTDAANVSAAVAGTLEHGATPEDADSFAMVDTEAGNGLKRFTWANMKARLKAFFDPLYATAAQGAKADTALQPGQVGSAAAQSTAAFASASQGAKADTAVQPAALNAEASTRAAADTAIDQKAAAAFARTAPLVDYPADASVRPGKNPALFTSTLTGRAASALPLSADDVVSSDYGEAIRKTGPFVIAPRDPRVILDDHSYRVTFAVTDDTPGGVAVDPQGDTMRIALRWLNGNYATVGTRVVEDKALAVSDGYFVKSVVMSKLGTEGQGGLDIKIPPTARHWREFAESFSASRTRSVHVLSVEDTTSGVVLSGDVSALSGRVTTVEGAVATKAPQATVDALSTVVGTKAAQTALVAVDTASVQRDNALSTGLSAEMTARVAETALRKSRRFYTTGQFPKLLAVAGDGRRLPGTPLALDFAEARKPRNVFMTGRPGVVQIALDGRRLGGNFLPTTYADARKLRTIYITGKRAGRYVPIAADGRLATFPAQSSTSATDFSTGATWSEGTGYTGNPSVFLPALNKRIIIPAIGQSYNKGALLAGTAYNVFARNAGFAQTLAAGLFPNGIRSSTFIDLVSPNNDEVTEPYILEATHTILEMAQAEFGAKFKICAGIAARGGWNYYRLKRPSPIWDLFVAFVEDAVAAAISLGEQPIVPAVFVGEGEADASAASGWEAKSHLRQWRKDVEAMVKARTGQTESVSLVFYATNRSLPTGAIRASGWQIATRELANEDPSLFCCVGPAYAVTTDATAHPTQQGYRQLGALMGRGWYHQVLGTGRRACDVVNWYPTGAQTARLEVWVPEDGSLVRDESSVQVGYSANPADANWNGPGASGTDATAHDGGIYVMDKDGNFGVVSAVVTGNVIDLTFSRTPHWPSTRIKGGVRPQSGTTAGTSQDCARMIFRGSVGFTMPDDARPIYDWLLPFDLYASKAA